MTVRIRIPNIFSGGWRHDLARAIWAAAADSWSHDDVEVDLYPHETTHKAALRCWWFDSHKRAGTVQVFTETDFLPEPTFPETARKDAAKYGLTGPEARHRTSSDDPPADHSDRSGAWLLIAAPERIRKMSFYAVEPGASLTEECKGMQLLHGEFRDPGLYYEGYGLHTFWSRAWHGKYAFDKRFDGVSIMEKIDGHLDHYRKLWNV